MRKRTFAIPLSILAAGGVAGGAYAATQSSSNPQQAFLADAAHRLHVSPARLSGALKQALIDRLNAAVAAGHLTAAEAKMIEQRLGQSHGLPMLPGILGPGRFSFHARMPALGGPPAMLTAAAAYLGLTDRALVQELRAGKTPAQIAAARGKSKTGLEKAITAALKAQLEKAASAGHLPRAVEQRILNALNRRVQSMVNGRAGGFPFMLMGPAPAGFPPPAPGRPGTVPGGPGGFRQLPGGPGFPGVSRAAPGSPSGSNLRIPPQVLRGLI